MQAAASPFPPPPPSHTPYPHIYHPQIPVPQDHELKRQYLTLLPPQQIIDICLNFDLHVPPYVKSSIWPLDINAAISSLRKASPSTGESSSQKNSDDQEAVMASLKKPAEPAPPSSSQQEQPSNEQTNEPRPPDKQGSATPGPPPSQAETSTAASTPKPPQPPALPSGYPHQLYGYHPQTAYPHAPYYSPPPGYPAPYPAYPGYPMPPGYPTPPPGNLPPPNPLFPAAPAHPPHHAPEQSSNDDLPSYEEMIVEALMDCSDPEGCAPKDLFTWMASRYPLQSNFRPSASQALQKAYKRGRFEKSTGGKYRLNANWEGGNTSRRTTRRPQTQSQSSAPSNNTTTSPFTHAPLVHHHHHQPPQHTQQSQFIGQPFGFPFQQPPQHAPPVSGFSAYSGPPAPPAATTTATTATQDKAEPETSGDAYEAAQNILKAINFGSLLQFPTEDDTQKADDTATITSAGEDSVPHPVSATVVDDIINKNASHLSILSDPAALLSPPPNQNAAMEVGTRAELQAQLALLAAQLAELSQEDDGATPEAPGIVVSTAPPAALSVPPVPPVPASPPAPTDTTAHPPPITATIPPPVHPFSAPAIPPAPLLHVEPPSEQIEEYSPRLLAIPQEEEDSSDDDDMEEVI